MNGYRDVPSNLPSKLLACITGLEDNCTLKAIWTS